LVQYSSVFTIFLVVSQNVTKYAAIITSQTDNVPNVFLFRQRQFFILILKITYKLKRIRRNLFYIEINIRANFPTFIRVYELLYIILTGRLFVLFYFPSFSLLTLRVFPFYFHSSIYRVFSKHAILRSC